MLWCYTDTRYALPAYDQLSSLTNRRVSHWLSPPCDTPIARAPAPSTVCQPPRDVLVPFGDTYWSFCFCLFFPDVCSALNEIDMPFPPPPPPPPPATLSGPPPPPPPPGLPAFGGGGGKKGHPAQARDQLLQSIRQGKPLKKTVTNDKSKPLVDSEYLPWSHVVPHNDPLVVNHLCLIIFYIDVPSLCMQLILV